MSEYTFRQKLQYNFQKQADFAKEYSPLYRRIHQNVSAWLAAVTADSDPIVAWLENAVVGRSPFLAPNLLAAALHQRVLADDPAVADLATFYPGSRQYQREDLPFSVVLREAIMASREAMLPFMQTANVQTNETGRGFTWLWPLSYVGWDKVHLLDIGASAGLNLVANRRRYEVMDVMGRSLFRLGEWRESDTTPQFRVRAQGEIPDLDWPGAAALPQILSRTGIDMHPFVLDSEKREQVLLSFIWADQMERLGRLREGLAAFKSEQANGVPVTMRPVHLPGELAAFLAGYAPAGDAPHVLYNTYMTTYLPEKGESLKLIIGEWAAGLDRPVIWIQLEPVRGASRFGWCAITVDYWRNGEQHHWQLAMSHPHVNALEFSPGLAEFVAYWASDPIA